MRCFPHRLRLVALVVVAIFAASIASAEQAFFLKNIKPDRSATREIPRFVPLNDLLYFSADDGINGKQLWQTDGTAEGTHIAVRVNEIGATTPRELQVYGDKLLFAATTSQSERVLYVSDGTSAGTSRIGGLSQIEVYSDPSSMFPLGDYIYFGAISGALNIGWELWRASASNPGSNLVKDIRVGTSSSSPVTIGSFKGELLFLAKDQTEDARLWRSDGTEAGTTLLDMPGLVKSAYIYGDTLLLRLDDGVIGDELWRSDGTLEGTTLVKDISEGTDSTWGKGSEIANWFTYNGIVYFRAIGTGVGIELYRTDGTPEGTYLVKDIDSRAPNFLEGNGAPDFFAEIGGLLYFIANDGVHGKAVWRSDGTNGGTWMVKDLNPSSVAGSIEYLFNVNGYFCFRGSSPVGEVPWISDGTEAGTRVLVAPNPDNLRDSNYFTAYKGNLILSGKRGTDIGLWLVNIPPIVESIAATSPNLSNATTVDFTVTFSEEVNGVDANDFTVLPGVGITEASVASVAGGPKIYTVTLNTGTGDGTLGLELVDDDSIIDLFAEEPMSLGGLGKSDGAFTSPDTYTLDKTSPASALSSTAPSVIGLADIEVFAGFLEPVTGLQAENISVSNGMAHDVSEIVAGTAFRFFVMPTGAGTLEIQLGPGAAQDAAGNLSLSSNTLSRTVVVPEGEGEDSEGEGEGEGEGDGGEGEGEGEGEEPILGACCLGDGACQVFSVTLCEAFSGTYLGDGTTCTPEACLPPPSPYHTGDQNQDNRYSLGELLRLIQFYNTGSFHCDPAGEEGFAPGAGDQTCAPHSNDYAPQDWKIDFDELLRVIQLYNIGGYVRCEGGEDGFCVVE